MECVSLHLLYLPGNDAFKAGKWTEAVEGYTRAIDLDPEDKVQPARPVTANAHSYWYDSRERPFLYASSILGTLFQTGYVSTSIIITIAVQHY